MMSLCSTKTERFAHRLGNSQRLGNERHSLGDADARVLALARGLQPEPDFSFRIHTYVEYVDEHLST
jgi:hypothetical protein